MILLRGQNITKHYGAATILEDASLMVQTGERVALVGINGAGKSTLLKILLGQLEADAGEVFRARDLVVGYLAQQTLLPPENTVWQEMASVFKPLLAIEVRLQELTIEISEAEGAQLEQLTAAYEAASEQFRLAGGYEYQARIRSVLKGMRFTDADFQRAIGELSGGQKTRLNLARLLLEEPGLLVLDEPTNYLDMETLQWLENHLQRYPGAILIVSHDRYFLDALVTVTYEVSRHQTKRYVGNYSQFIELKAQEWELLQKQYERQQDEMQRLSDFVQKNIARASTSKRARSRQKQLEKIVPLDAPQGAAATTRMQLQSGQQSGRVVLQVKNLQIGYGPKVLLKNISFMVEKGERVALLGPNGLGKSTLIKTLMQKLPALGGEMMFGHQVVPSYYAQEHELLHSQHTILQEVWDSFPQLPEAQVRSVLGNFLFSDEEVFKEVSRLSGGERARVALAKLMLTRANFLIMDEPTNHLDIVSKEVLEGALSEYDGTLLFVSHDRYFLNQIATKVIELRPDGCDVFLGNFDDYQRSKAQLEQSANDTAAAVSSAGAQSYVQQKEQKKEQRKQQKRQEELETKMAQVEQRIADMEQELCDPDVYENFARAQELQLQLTGLRQDYDKMFAEWATLVET